MIHSLAELRLHAVQSIVTAEIDWYLLGRRRRRCAQCGQHFTPRNRMHFLHTDRCRRLWRRGLFRQAIA
jgi:transcriptional regulator NrdR family protein